MNGGMPFKISAALEGIALACSAWAGNSGLGITGLSVTPHVMADSMRCGRRLRSAAGGGLDVQHPLGSLCSYGSRLSRWP